MSERYIVTGPWRAYEEKVPGLGAGPRYDCRESFLVVNAPNRHWAKWAAWRQARQVHALWWQDIGIDEHPLKGVEVQTAPDDEHPDSWGDYYVDGAVS